jgi:hypothetical protein
MEENYIPKYCDAFSLLLISPTGNLRKLYCPFRVICIISVRGLKPGIHLWVAEVLSNHKGELVYIIFDKQYNYKYFVLDLKLDAK